MQLELATALQVTAALDSRAIDPLAIATRITTDSRDVQPGDLFVALRGDRFDGHQFVATAIAQGAIAAIVDRVVDQADPVHPGVDSPLPQIVVADTLAAYQAIAHWWRKTLGTTVIGITGSVGKTTTKELIAAVLAPHGQVLKTQANYNNEIGVPKTLLDLTPEHDFAVVEMAMRGEGQIAELARIAQPDIGVIVNVGTAHIGLLGSREAIARAKCELLEEMPATSTAILNADNALLMETAASRWQGQTITYGFTGGDLQGTLSGDRQDVLDLKGQCFPLPLLGVHNASNYLAAIAVGQALQLDLSGLTQGLRVTLPQGRAKQIELADDVVLLDETYNAGLESMLAALDLLAQTPGARRIAVLGTMKELGEQTIAFHQQVGDRVAQLGFDGLCVVAEPEAAAALTQALETQAPQAVWHIETEETDAARDRLTAYLRTTLRSGDRVLFKASHSVALDQVVTALQP